MTGRVWGALAIPLAALAGFVTMFACGLTLRAWYWLREWPARRRVQRAVERETAVHVGDLVPEQREPSDPVWWEFVPGQQQGEDR